MLFSTDGLQYNTLGKIDATNAGKYKTTHEQVCESFPGKIIYYKLKTVDADGSFVLSNVITTKIKGSQNISIYENPVNDFLTIKGLKKIGTIRIADVNGKVLYEQSVNQENIKMNASFLQAGIYFLQYFNDGNTTSLKFIKK